MQKLSPTEAKRTLSTYQAKPSLWVRDVLGNSLWAKQAAIVDDIAQYKHVAVKSCHSAGKSFLAARVVLSFLYARPGALVLTTAPTDRQVRHIIWREIHDAFRRAKGPLGGQLDVQKLEVEPGWLAMGFTTSSTDDNRFQGFHAKHTLVVVDESCGVSPQTNMGIKSILSGESSYRLDIGNPVDIATPFGALFSRDGIKRHTISAFDTPNFTAFGITQRDIEDESWKEKLTAALPAPYLVTPQWVSEMWLDCGRDIKNPAYMARVLAEFPTEGTSSLLPLTHIERAQNTTLLATDADVMRLAVDVARFGDDRTVIYSRRGPVVRLYADYGKKDTMETAGVVARAIRELNVKPQHVVVDVVGIGAGVVDRLRELTLPVVEFNGARDAKDKEQFVNRRAECYWTMRQAFENGEIDFDERANPFAAQASQLQWKLNSRGKIMIESKEEIKKRGLPSPDHADCVSMLFDVMPTGTLAHEVAFTPSTSRYTNDGSRRDWSY